VKEYKHAFFRLSPAVIAIYGHYNGYRNDSHLIMILGIYSITIKPKISYCRSPDKSATELNFCNYRCYCRTSKMYNIATPSSGHRSWEDWNG